MSILIYFVERCLKINQNSCDYIDGVAIVDILIAILENMNGMIDSEIPQIVEPILDNLFPCAIITPLDCFWEGSKILGPDHPVRIP